MNFSIENGANVYFNKTPISKVYNEDTLMWTDEVKEVDTQYVTPTPTPTIPEKVHIFKITISKIRCNSTGFVEFSEIRFYDSNQDLIDFSDYSSISSNGAVYNGYKEDTILDDNYSSYFKADFDPSTPVDIIITYKGSITMPQYFSIVTSEDSYDYDPVNVKIEYKYEEAIDIGGYTTLFNLVDLDLPKNRCKNSDLYDTSYIAPEPVPEGYIPMYNANWNTFTSGTSVKSEWVENPDGIHLGSNDLSYSSTETISNKTFINAIIDENTGLILKADDPEEYETTIYELIAATITDTTKHLVRPNTLTMATKINGTSGKNFKIAYYFFDELDNYIPAVNGLNNSIFVNAFINDYTNTVPIVSVPVNAVYYQISIRLFDELDPTMTADLISDCDIYYGFYQNHFYADDTNVFVQGNLFDDTDTKTVYNLYKINLLSNLSIESIRCDAITALNTNLKYKFYLFDKNTNYLSELVESNSLNEWSDISSTITIVDEDYTAKYISVAITTADDIDITPSDISSYRVVFKCTDIYANANDKSIAYLETKRSYDMTDIDRLTLSLSSPGINVSATTIYLAKNSIFSSYNKDYVYDIQKLVDNNINTTTNVSIDVSELNGNYYIGMANYYGNDFTFYDINKSNMVHETKSVLRFTIDKLRDTESNTVSFSKLKFYDVRKNQITLPECFSVSSSDNTIDDTDIENLINDSATSFTNSFSSTLSFTFNFETIVTKPYYMTITTSDDSIDNDIVSFRLEYSSNKGITFETIMQLVNVEMTEDRNTESTYFYIGYFKPITPGPDDPPLPPEPTPVVVSGWLPFTYDNWNLFNTDKTGYLCRSEITSNYQFYLRNIEYKHQSQETVTDFEQGDFDINGAKYSAANYVRTTSYIEIPISALTYSIISTDSNDVDLVNTVCFYDSSKNIIKNELCGIENDIKNYSVLSGTILLIPKEARYIRYSVKYLNNSSIVPTDIASSVINWNDNANSYKEVDLKQLDWFLSAIDLVSGKVKINDTSAERYLSLWNYVEIPTNTKRLCVELNARQSNVDVKWFIYCYDSNLNYIYNDSCSNYVNNNTYITLPELDDLKYIAVVSNYTVAQEYLNFARLTFELSEPNIHDFLANYCYAETKNKIDLSMVGKINADIDTVLPNSYLYVSKYSMLDNPNVFMPYRAIPIDDNGDTIVSLDVNNLYDSYYVGFAAYNNSEITIKAIDKSEKTIETDVEPVNLNRYLDLMQFNRDWYVGEYVEDGVFTINSSGTCLMCDYMVPIINSNIVIGALYENTTTTPHTKRKIVSKLCYYDMNKRYFSDTDWSSDWSNDYNYERYIAPEGVAYYKVLLKYVDESPATTSYLDCKIYFDSDINMDNLYVYTGVYAIECKDNVSYIDTGIKPGFDKEIELKFVNLKWNSKFIVGAIDSWPVSNSDSAFLLTNNTTSEPVDHKLDVDCYFHPSSSYSNPILIDNVITNNEEFIIKITFEENSDPIKNYNMCIYINNASTPIVTEAISDSDIDFSTFSNITLFNYLSSTSNPASVLSANAGDYQLRSLIIRDLTHSNRKLIEYIPILDYKQVPCLFDLVNYQYIYNANLGGQGFDVVDTPLPVELRMPDYTDIKGIYHLQSFVSGEWKNTLNVSDPIVNHWLADVTFIGNVIKSNEELIISPNDYAIVDYNGNDFNTEFSFYIIAKLDEISTKYSHKNLFNTNLIKQSSYFNNDRTSYNIAYALEPDTYYVLSCNIPLDNSNKATITIGQDNCYTSNPITVLTDNTGELIITLNETEYYTTGAELVTIVDDERQVNYEIQLEKGINQTASDTPTTYEPFILPNVKNGTILSTLTANGGFELGITDRSLYDKPNLITLRNSNGNSVICSLSHGGIDPTEYHLYTIVGKTINNASTLDLYVDGVSVATNFSYDIDNSNSIINICRTIDTNGNYVCSDHIINIKFMAFGITAHTSNQINSNVSDTGNLIEMYNIQSYTIPEYTITELYISDFVNKKIACTNGIEVITNSENHYSTSNALTIPTHTKTFTIKNVFGEDKVNLPFYALVYDSSNNIIDTTDSYKARQELCLFPVSNAAYLKFVLNKGVMSGSLLYADVIWNKDNKKYEIVDITTWESGTISTVNGTILPSNSIIRTGFIEIPDRVDSVLFEGVTKNSEPLQYTIFAYDNSYNYVNTYNNLITNNFEWKDNDVVTDILFNTQKNISYVKVIAQKSDADITANNVLHTKLAFMSRNSVAELTTSKWEQYDETNFGEPTITTVTNLNSLYYDEYIDITNGKYIVLNTILKGLKATDEFRYAIYFYDDSKNHISIDNYVSYWLSDMAIINITGTIFANAKYIRILLKDNTGNITTSDIDTSYITIVKNDTINNIEKSSEEILAELDERTTVLETDNVNIKNDLSDIEDDTTDLTDSASYVSGQVTTITSDIEDLKSDLLYLS